MNGKDDSDLEAYDEAMHSGAGGDLERKAVLGVEAKVGEPV